MGRIARFSANFSGAESGDTYTVLNAGDTRGFTVTGVYVGFEPHSMTGSSNELPNFSVTRYTGTASGGASGPVFNHTDGDSAETSILTTQTFADLTFGSDAVNGPAYWPGTAEWSGVDSTWNLSGGQFLAKFDDAQIYVAPGNSLLVHVTNVVSASVFFYEHLTP